MPTDREAAESLPGEAGADKTGADDGAPAGERAARLSPAQEAAQRETALQHKAEANEHFARGQADIALLSYGAAVDALPPYLHYDLAVLRSNMAACHLQLAAWQDAVKSATQALEALDKHEQDAADKTGAAADPTQAESTETETAQTPEKPAADDADDADVEEEIVSAGAAAAGRPLSPPPPSPPPPTARDLGRIRAKALLRRGRARSELGGWANLAGAEEDYRALAALPAGTLGDADRRLVQAQLRALPPRTAAAKEEEMGDMMGKLKELGNGLLRPFGISTDNFQMVQDAKTGGYSINFRQAPE